MSRLLAGAAIAVALGSVPARATVDLGQIMPLGDSITYGYTSYADPSSDTGYSFTTVPGGYRTEFYDRLTAAGYGFQFVGSSTENPSDTLTAAGQTAQEGHAGYVIGRPGPPASPSIYQYLSTDTEAATGTTGTPYLNDAVDPSDVLLDIGINNLITNYGVGETETDMTSLVGALFAARPGAHVFLANLIPYAGIDPYKADVSDHVVEFNAFLPALVSDFAAQGYAITLVDVYDQFVLPTGAPDPSLLGVDGIHPTAAGYTVMGDAFADAVLESASAPEPTSAALLGVGTVALFARRRRRR